MGFAATAPRLGEDESLAELRYLGVRPSAWGQDVGETLLRELEPVLRASGSTRSVVGLSGERAVRTAGLHAIGGAATPSP
jgi:GNAT superfamily N-acetyltransferase